MVDLLVGWAPALFEACMDHLMLSDSQKVQASGVFQHQDLVDCSAEEAVKRAASCKGPYGRVAAA